MQFDNVRFLCGVCNGDKIIASASECNALFEIDKNTGKSEYISSFPEGSVSSGALHRSAFLNDDEVVFIPSRATNIHIYNISTNSIDTVTVCRNGYKGAYVGEEIDNKIYMLPESSGGNIVVYNKLTKDTNELLSREQLAGIVKSSKKNQLLFIRVGHINNIICLAQFGTNNVYLLNTDSAEVIEKKVPINNLLGSFPGDNCFWLVSNDKDTIYKSDTELDNCTGYEFERALDGDGREINWIVDLGDNVYALPAMGNGILKREGNKFVQMYKIEEVCPTQKMYNPIICNEEVILLPFGSKYMYVLDADEVYRSEIEGIGKNTELYKSIIKEIVNDGALKRENVELTLSQFIEGVLQE